MFRIIVAATLLSGALALNADASTERAGRNSQTANTAEEQHDPNSFIQNSRKTQFTTIEEELFEADNTILDQHPFTYALRVPAACALVVFVAYALRSLNAYEGRIEGRNFYVLLFYWMSMSLLMNLLNKQCSHLLRCPFTLVLIQMLAAIILLARTPLTGMKKEDLWRWSACAMLFGGMLCSSLLAFMHSSVTCLVVLRNCMPLFTLPLEKAILPNQVHANMSMVVSMIVIAIGSGLYARFAPGHGVTSIGVGWIAVNCVVTVVHRVTERYLLTSDMRLSFEAMTLVNNVIPLVPVAVLMLATGEHHQWPQYQNLLHSPVDIAVLACSGVVGLCLGQSSIMVQKCIDATTMMVLQVTNKLGIIVAAMLFFNDRFTLTSFIGCAASLLGCAAYGAAQQAAREGKEISLYSLIMSAFQQQPLLPTTIKKHGGEPSATFMPTEIPGDKHSPANSEEAKGLAGSSAGYGALGQDKVAC